MIKTALLFAGQGAQSVGMGREFAATSATARALFAEAHDALGIDLAKVCFEGPEAELTNTENAQPGIYLVSWIALQLLRERRPDLEFAAAAGLSLGEFTALAAANAIGFSEGLRLVRQRGRLMQEACEAAPGAMAAVIGLELEPTRAVCAEAGVEVANLNCPGQIVISGERSAIERACELAKNRGAKRALPLAVAGAYHSRLMASARAGLSEALAGVDIQAPAMPVISNVTAAPHGDPAEIRELLVQQVTSSVLWEDSVRRLLADGCERFIELGPGTALSGFMKRIEPGVRILNVADAASLAKTVEAL